MAVFNTALALQKISAARTDETDELMRNLEAIETDTTLSDAMQIQACRNLASTASLNTLTCVMLTVHTVGQATALRGQIGQDRSPERGAVSTLTSQLHPWSPEMGTQEAYRALSEHLTEGDREVLTYLGKHRGAKMLPEALDRFFDRLTWAGKVYEAIRRKDKTLGISNPQSSKVLAR